jgi:hypothetical protein
MSVTCALVPLPVQWNKSSPNKITVMKIDVWVFFEKQLSIFLYECVCACSHGWGHACACVRPCVCGYTSAGVCLRVCGLTYPSCFAQAPYCLRPLWLHHIFRHYLINGTIFGETLLNTKCVFLFSLQLLFETFLILRRIQRVIVINVKTSSCKVPVIIVGF